MSHYYYDHTEYANADDNDNDCIKRILYYYFNLSFFIREFRFHTMNFKEIKCDPIWENQA